MTKRRESRKSLQVEVSEKCKKEEDDKEMKRRPSSKPMTSGVCVALYQDDASESDDGHASLAILLVKAKIKKPAQN